MENIVGRILHSVQEYHGKALRSSIENENPQKLLHHFCTYCPANFGIIYHGCQVRCHDCHSRPEHIIIYCCFDIFF